MRFSLIDRITELTPNESITAVKALSLAEEYLADHFPLFPVMPGVLMLEAMHEAAAWLLRYSDDFAHSVIMLKEAKSVTFKEFVAPGQILTVTAEMNKQDERTVRFKAKGVVDGRDAVSARLTLERLNLANEDPNRQITDAKLIKELRNTFDLLYIPRPV
jgi:3-hydroxyacyl-[acyl-carrier-protein] dehydratase